MPKRARTPDPQIIAYPDGTLYVRVGDRERSLKTKDFGVASKRKGAELAKIDGAGDAAARLRVRDVYKDYITFRKRAVESEAAGPVEVGPHRRRRTISDDTFAEIEMLWRKHLSPFWGPVRLDKIEEEKWDEYCDQSVVVDLANHRKVFYGFLDWCKSKKYVKYRLELSIPPVERRPRYVLKPQEIRQLFEHAEGSLLVFVSMYLFMGMRRKEIMTLRWDGVHFGEHYVYLRKSEVKTRRARAVPLNAFVETLLLERLKDQRARGIATPYVFPNAKRPNKHASISGLKTAWHTVRRRCGWPEGHITPHDLRATFEAYAHKAKDFTDTQREKFAGASIEVQKRTYVNFGADDVRGLEAVVQVDGLDAILKNKTTGNERGEATDVFMH